MKQKITILLLISVLLIANTGCKKKEINKPESTTEISKKDKIPKISKKELSAMKKKAKRELKLHDYNYNFQKVEFEPEYYKKIGDDSWQEFIEKHTADGDVEKYSLDNIVILEGYEKDSSVADLVVFAKKKEKWKFLYVFK
ncbi:hypothetical protein [Anaerostipes faecis]|uniref:hypothetical protein n=1 Tax=Anaerostipes faecis TaxID=2880702 RepID=UPI0011DE2665|nr:hypothetical protein [Anaerostipes faecis]